MQTLPLVWKERRAAAVAALALLVFAPVSAVAQTVRLDDVIAGVLRGTPAVQRGDERVRRAEGELRQASGAFDWTATAESGWEQLYVPRARDGFLTTDLDTPGAWRTVVGLGKRFRNGIEVQPGVSIYAATDARAGQAFGLTEPRPALNLTIPLMRGWGADNAPAANERAAAAALQGSTHARVFALQRAAFDAVQVYWRCLSVRQQLEVLTADQHAADDYVSSLRERVNQGRLEPTVLDRALANQAVQHVTLSRAGLADEQCRRELAIAMGGSLAALPTPVGEFPAMEGVREAAAALNETALNTLALARREDLIALARYDAAESERLRGARNGQERRVDIYIDPTKILLRVAQSFGGNAQQGQLSAAIAAENEARINFEQLQSQIQLDIANAVRNLRAALAEWISLTQSAGLLENVVSDAQRRAEAGVISQAEYRDTQAELAAIRRQVIDAKLQYASSLAALRLATGTIEIGEGISPARVATVFRSLPDR